MISTVFHSVEFNGDTLVYFSRKIDTWKQRFPFYFKTDLLTGEEEKKTPVILITHTRVKVYEIHLLTKPHRN